MLTAGKKNGGQHEILWDNLCKHSDITLYIANGPFNNTQLFGLFIFIHLLF